MLFTILGVVVFAVIGIALGTWFVLKVADKTSMDLSDSIFSLFGVVILVIAIIWSTLS